MMGNSDGGIEMLGATTLDHAVSEISHGSWPGDLSGMIGEDNHMLAYKAFNGSLDAAKALHSSLLPDCWWRSNYDGRLYHFAVALDGIWHAMLYGSDADPARAWLIAILKWYEVPDNSQSGK